MAYGQNAPSCEPLTWFVESLRVTFSSLFYSFTLIRDQHANTCRFLKPGLGSLSKCGSIRVPIQKDQALPAKYYQVDSINPFFYAILYSSQRDLQGHNRKFFLRGQSHFSWFFPPARVKSFFLVENFHFGTPKTDFRRFEKWKTKKKKGPLLIF